MRLIFSRTANANPADLANQLDTLDRVGDTLGMLGLGVPRRVVIEQRDPLRKVVHGGKQAEEGTLLDVAGALLFVEASLDDNIERLGGGDEGRHQLEIACRSRIAADRSGARSSKR
ncbi:MAG: hypothetical protein IPK97_07615 [Ahniella sp.]|nr:hypothetical protein [Ahniella sp.]